MKQTNKYALIYCLLLLAFSVCTNTGCKKFLDEKPFSSLDIPDMLPELQGLMDKYNTLNINDPCPDEISADDYYLTFTDWSSQIEQHRRLYTWEKDNLFTNQSFDWSAPYTSIYYANTVLEAIEKIPQTPANTIEWDNIKGQALFWRAKNLMQVATIWAAAYNKSTAVVEQGIPVRLTTDFNSISSRATIEQTYQRIIDDLKNSIPLLPVTPKHVMRPSRPGAAGFLARTYLSMRMYDSCFKYADISLSYYRTLINYNSSPFITPTANFPFIQYNPEVIFYSIVNTPSILLNSRAKIDSGLYQLYESNDLRKSLFFRNNNNGSFGYKGSYSGGNGLFTGISTDELFLMRAEANARMGKITEAINDLNTLMITRWKTGTFIPFSVLDQSSAINTILTERRKELLMRNLRWMDIKRLNKEGLNINLKRKLNDQLFTLESNSLKFILPIPDDIIALTGMQQNPR